MVAQPYRVIVVEDDTDVAFYYTKTALEKRRCVVQVVFDPMLAGVSITSVGPNAGLSRKPSLPLRSLRRSF